MFMDDFTKYTKAFIGTQKSNWFQCFKEFYKLAKTKTQQAWPIQGIQSDY